MQSEILKKLSRKMVAEPNNFMSSFRRNLEVYIDEKDISLKDIAEAADISYETLKTLVYGDSKDCKLSTAVALAKALEISVDELVGCGTISPEVRESIQITRNLPANYVNFVRWAIRYQERMLNTEKTPEKTVNVNIAEQNNEGNIVFSNNYEVVDVSGISEMYRPKIFMGIRLPGDAYMPKYCQNEVLLIANDRLPMTTENSVIIYGGYLWLAKRKVEVDEKGQKHANYYSIRDGRFRVEECKVEEVIGYICATIMP